MSKKLYEFKAMIIQISGTEFNNGLLDHTDVTSASHILLKCIWLEVRVLFGAVSFCLSAFILLSELQIVDSFEVGTQKSLLPQYGNFKCLHKFYLSAFSQE